MSKPERDGQTKVEAPTDGNKENKTKTQKWKMADFNGKTAILQGFCIPNISRCSYTPMVDVQESNRS